MSEGEPLKLSFLQKTVFEEYFEEGENIFYIIQNHWWLFVLALFKMALIFVPSTFVLLIFGHRDPYVFLGSLAASLISFAFLGIEWYNLYADAFILTDKNIIWVEWDSIVRIRSSRISYNEVESASVNMEGFMPTLLGFGDLKIETANETFNAELKGAANAREAERQILINKERYSKADYQVETEILKKALRGIVDEYILEKQEEKENEIKEKELDELKNRFEKYKIRGPRFHQTDDVDGVDTEDLKEDRFEQYRILEDFKSDTNSNKEDSEFNTRFSRFREKSGEDSIDEG